MADDNATFSLATKNCSTGHAHVWINVAERKVKGAALLLLRTVDNTGCDVRCDSRDHDNNKLLFSACCWCVMNQATSKGWVYLGEQGANWHCLRKQLPSNKSPEN